jgi:hypothetical protein
MAANLAGLTNLVKRRKSARRRRVWILPGEGPLVHPATPVYLIEPTMVT